jgi:branched-chain amino acid transport system ATP-binding protein
MPLLEAKNLEVKMGLQQILFGVSVKVEENSIVAVLGSNGVGKTTLMRASAACTGWPKARCISMGQEITNLRTHKTTALGIGQAPEGRQIFANMTLLENLQMGAYHQPAQHFKDKTCRWSMRCSPSWPSAKAKRPARSPAASSRCSPSAGP